MPGTTALLLPRGRVLAVDDSVVMRELVTASLEAAGYHVEAVASGDAALVAAAREAFDAFILDVDMPGMDGMAVGRALRRLVRTGQLVKIGHGLYTRAAPSPYDGTPAPVKGLRALATEALGLGGWMHCGFLSLEVLRLLGFRIAAPEGAATLANPIGLDGVLQACCPPYYPNMDAAVDAVLASASRNISGSSGAVPYLMSEVEHRAGTVKVSDEGIACTKAICNYIFETYGRFPGGIDAMHLMWFMQVHHIDTDYYDRFFSPGAYGPSHAHHMATWHP